ncbi:MAG: hypothetical protein ACRDTC_02570, partial [Pseudonocardiaceae bacterium]
MISDDVAQALATVKATTPGSFEWAAVVDELAEAWLRAGELDHAIATRQAAVEKLTDTPSLMIDMMHNLGIDLMNRYERTSVEIDLRKACLLAESVYAVAPHSSRLTAAATLAGRLSRFAELPGEQAALNRA